MGSSGLLLDWQERYLVPGAAEERQQQQEHVEDVEEAAMKPNQPHW